MSEVAPTPTTEEHAQTPPRPVHRRRLAAVANGRWLPVGLAIAALVALNAGMYTRLSAAPVAAGLNETATASSAVAAAIEEPAGPGTAEVSTDDAAQLASDPQQDLTPAISDDSTTPAAAGSAGDISPGGVVLVGGSGFVAAPVLIDAPTPIAIAPSAQTAITAASGFTDAFDGASDSAWLPLGGAWSQVDGRLLQDQSSGFDLSVIHQETTTYPLAWRATFQHEQGTGAGLLFDLPSLDGLNGGHMVRYMGGGDAVAWGYFDDRGVFIGQGGSTVEPPGDAPHALEVRADGTTYGVYLDDEPLALDVPIVEPAAQSHVGLVTSESRVAYDDVSLTTAGALDGRAAPAELILQPAGGAWELDERVVVQTETAAVDYTSGTGLIGERFVLEADIRLPDPAVSDKGAGGGLIFAMQGPSDPRLGYMVRFANGGQELFWGRYDANGTFVGTDGVLLESPAGEPRTLRLDVRDGAFDIVVNDTMVASGIPIEGSAGSIGLLSFGGPVTFEDVEMSPRG